MKKGLTELVIILDQSGSMHGLESDVVGGFNSLVESQIKSGGETLITTIMFSDTSDLVHNRTNAKSIKKLTENDYEPHGCTALLDAVGNAVCSLEKTHRNIKEDELPENIIFSIMTDGLENASIEYSKDMVKKLIESQRKIGWEFMFQAANIDAFDEGYKLGMDSKDISTFKADKVGVSLCMCQISKGIIEKRKNHKKNID